MTYARGLLLFIAGIFFFSELILFAQNISDKSGNIKLVFRLDDFTLSNSKFYDDLFDVYEKYNTPLCLGVIPFDEKDVVVNELDSIKLNQLKNKISSGKVDITLHGYNHLDNLRKDNPPNKLTRFLLNLKYSEFSEVPWSLQFEKIRKGKTVLDSLLGTDIKTFIPPWNSYDNHTLEALDSLQFEAISAGFDGVATSKRIKYIPNTYENFNQLPQVLNNLKKQEVIIVVLLHPYSFKECCPTCSLDSTKRINLNDLDTLLNWINNQNQIQCISFSGLLKTESNLGSDRYAAHSLMNSIEQYFYTGGFFSTDYQRRIQHINILLNIFLVIGVFMFTNKLIRLVKLQSKKRLLLFSLLAAILIIGIIFLRGAFIPKWILLLLVLFGVVLSITKTLIQHRNTYK